MRGIPLHFGQKRIMMMICLQLRRSEDDLAIHQQKIAKNACKEGRTNYFTDKKKSFIQVVI